MTECETCVNPASCNNCKQDCVVVTTPIARAFDAKNTDGSIRHILVGYGVLLNELDDFGTALSRELVEDSIPLLMKYPAVRYMHKEPFGHIVFDESIEGFQTHLDEKGFFVVAEIGSQFEKEFSLIKRGGWGFSWGMFPSAPPVQKKVGDKMGLVYEKGRVYEFSVVDVPAQPNASVTVIRATANHTPRSGFRAQLEAAHPSNPTATAESEPETRATSGFRAMLEEARGHRFVDDSTIHRKIDSGTNQSLTFVGYSYRGFDRIELWRRQDGLIITKFPEPPPEPKPAKPITRGCGFAAMLEAAFRSDP